MPIGEDIAASLAKLLPVKALYDDALSPGAKQVGYLLEDLIKVLRLSTFPIQFAAAAQDRFRSFLERSVRRVPEERLITPAPEILGPVLEGIRYEAAESPVEEMFSHLLSCSMDRDRVRLAHPAYARVVRELVPDEALILQLLSQAKKFDRVSLSPLIHVDGQLMFGSPKREHDDLPTDRFDFPNNSDLYTDHLFHLGLAHFVRMRDEAVAATSKDVAKGKQTGSRVFERLQLTLWGSSFVSACLPGADPVEN